MSVTSTSTDRDRVVRRNTVLLAVAQGFVQMSFPVMLVIGGPAATDITGRESSAGVLWGVYFVSAAIGAALIGRWMDRVGRRPGLVLAYVLVAAAGIGAALSIRAGSFAGLVLSTVPFGAALGGANLGRGAVAGMYPLERRGRAVGILLAAGTAGAVGQMAMVGVMGVTPTALHTAHHGGTVISFVVSFHIAGMFAFAPVIGRWMDRAGRRSALLAGCLTSIAGALVAATEAGAAIVGGGVFLFRAGWFAS